MIDYSDIVSMCGKFMSEYEDDVLCYPLNIYFSTINEIVSSVSYKFSNSTFGVSH